MSKIALNVNPHMSREKVISTLTSKLRQPSVHNAFSLSALQSLLNHTFYPVSLLAGLALPRHLRSHLLFIHNEQHGSQAPTDSHPTAHRGAGASGMALGRCLKGTGMEQLGSGASEQTQVQILTSPLPVWSCGVRGADVSLSLISSEMGEMIRSLSPAPCFPSLVCGWKLVVGALGLFLSITSFGDGDKGEPPARMSKMWSTMGLWFTLDRKEGTQMWEP